MFDLLSIKQRRQFTLAEKPGYYLDKFTDQIYDVSDEIILQVTNNKIL